MFVLFQEIPGCETCQNFGRQPLSHPLIVEAIEEHFIPVLVYNNRDGEDATLLKRFSEPSWNNPIVRYLGPDGKDLIERVSGVWTTEGTTARMIAALQAANRKVPKYLANLQQSLTAKTETATFAMHCYWEGEALLGSVDGVYATRAAWRDGLEVVEVKYDPQLVNYRNLVETAQSMECASRVFAHSPQQLETARQVVGELAVAATQRQQPRVAKDSDQKYYLRNSRLKNLPLTDFQATKINAALKNNQPVEKWLSDRQRQTAK